MAVQRPEFRGHRRARAHLRLSPPYLGGEGKAPNKLRVAPFSNDTHGFANITTVTIGPATQKVTVTLPGNCSGISFQRQDDPGNWATIAYNLGT